MYTRSRINISDLYIQCPTYIDRCPHSSRILTIFGRPRPRPRFSGASKAKQSKAKKQRRENATQKIPSYIPILSILSGWVSVRPGFYFLGCTYLLYINKHGAWC